MAGSHATARARSIRRGFVAIPWTRARLRGGVAIPDDRGDASCHHFIVHTDHSSASRHYSCFVMLRSSSDRQFGFRDAGHFYYPLYQRVQEEWNQGRWPLWEPEENAGMPLLGNPTAAVLYPGKLVFAVLPYAWRCGSTSWRTRRWRSRRCWC